MTSSPTEIVAGVDWLSLTTGPDDDAQVAYDRCRALALEQEDAGDKVGPWASHGYKGFGSPHLRCGVRDQDTLVELSGSLADRYWREFLPLARTVTRLDTAVTCTYGHDVRDLAVQAYLAPSVQFRPGLPPIRKVIYQEKDGGQTCYLGAASSARRGRLYDKHAESRGDYPPNTWRWELQERRPMGGVTAGTLGSCDDVPDAIRALVRGFFSAHGVEPWFQSDGTPVHRPSRRDRTDLSKWLDWLRRGVGPGVRRWANRTDRDTILRALGLDDQASSS